MAAVRSGRCHTPGDASSTAGTSRSCRGFETPSRLGRRYPEPPAACYRTASAVKAAARKVLAAINGGPRIGPLINRRATMPRIIPIVTAALATLALCAPVATAMPDRDPADTTTAPQQGPRGADARHAALAQERAYMGTRDAAHDREYQPTPTVRDGAPRSVQIITDDQRRLIEQFKRGSSYGGALTAARQATLKEIKAPQPASVTGFDWVAAAAGAAAALGLVLLMTAGVLLVRRRAQRERPDRGFVNAHTMAPAARSPSGGRCTGLLPSPPARPTTAFSVPRSARQVRCDPPNRGSSAGPAGVLPSAACHAAVHRGLRQTGRAAAARPRPGYERRSAGRARPRPRPPRSATRNRRSARRRG